MLRINQLQRKVGDDEKFIFRVVYMFINLFI